MLYYKSPLKILSEIQQEKRRKMFLFEMIVERILLKEGIDDDPFLSMFTKQAKAIGTFAGETAQAGTHALSALGKLAFTVKAIINDEPPDYLKKNLARVNDIRTSVEDKIKQYTSTTDISPVGHFLANVYLGGLPLGAQTATKVADFFDKQLVNERSFLKRIKDGFSNDNYGINSALEGLKEIISHYESYCDGYPSKTDTGKSSVTKFVPSIKDVVKNIKEKQENIFSRYYKSKTLNIKTGREEFLSQIFFDGAEVSRDISSYLLDRIAESLDIKKPTEINKIDKSDKTNTGQTGNVKVEFKADIKDATELSNFIIKKIVEEKRKDGLDLYELLKKEINDIKKGVIEFGKSDLIKQIDATHNVYEYFNENLTKIHDDQKELRKKIEGRLSSEKKAILDYLTKELKIKIGKIRAIIKNKAASYKGGNKDKLCASVEDIKNIIDSQKTSE
jgi:hypothetical protein